MRITTLPSTSSATSRMSLLRTVVYLSSPHSTPNRSAATARKRYSSCPSDDAPAPNARPLAQSKDAGPHGVSSGTRTESSIDASPSRGSSCESTSLVVNTRSTSGRGAASASSVVANSLRVASSFLSGHIMTDT
eukprot:Amastigsp_a510271_99.p6 type:complete len:134 gc:universal Amastigsp_a510271_99:1166-765(-)